MNSTPLAGAAPAAPGFDRFPEVKAMRRQAAAAFKILPVMTT
jgi:hypothetical protein